MLVLLISVSYVVGPGSSKAFGALNSDGTYFCDVADWDNEKYRFRDQINSFNQLSTMDPHKLAENILQNLEYNKNLDDLGKAFGCLKEHGTDPNSVNNLSDNVIEAYKEAASQNPEGFYEHAPYFGKNVFNMDYCKTVKLDTIKMDYVKTVQKINDEASAYRDEFNKDKDLPFTKFASDMVEFYPYDFKSAGDEARCLSQNNVPLGSVARFESSLPDVFKSNMDAVNKVSPDFVRYVLNNDSTVPEFGPLAEIVILIGIIGSIVIYRRFGSSF